MGLRGSQLLRRWGLACYLQLFPRPKTMYMFSDSRRPELCLVGGPWDPYLPIFLRKLLVENIILLCAIHSCKAKDTFAAREVQRSSKVDLDSAYPSKPWWLLASGAVFPILFVFLHSCSAFLLLISICTHFAAVPTTGF